MAKSISTGVEKALEALSKQQEDESNKAWRTLRNKLDSLLLSTNVLKSNDAMRACRQLDGMTPDERAIFIQQNWGPQYFDKAHSMLVQLEALEKKMAADQP